MSRTEAEREAAAAARARARAERERAREQDEGDRPQPAARRLRLPPLPRPRSGPLTLLAAVLVLWVVSGTVLRAIHSGRVLPGVSVAGVEVGGLSREAATARLRSADPPSVAISSESRQFSVTAPQAGLAINVKGTAERAYDEGRDGIVLAALRGPAFILGDSDLSPRYRPLDRKRLRAAVDRVADRVDQEPFLGALSINRRSLAVRVRTPRAGRAVDRRRTRALLLDAFRDGRDEIPLPVSRRSAPDPRQVRKVAAAAERYLSAPLRVSTIGGPATISPRTLAGVLSVEPVPGKSRQPRIRLGVDPQALGRIVAGLAERRDIAARDAALDAPAAPVSVTEQGDLSWRPRERVAGVIPPRTGRRIRPDRARDAIARAVRRGRHSATLPVEKVQPQVTLADARSASDLIGTFTTPYECCQPRVTNIQLIAAAVDGTVIAPGERFSLNAAAGPRTRAKGYKPAPFISGDELIDVVGGGVSQFSTTLYNAAYFAGLQLDSHQPHSFYISRYPAGREATLDYGTIDLLWTNDTGAPVLIRASAGDTSVTVSLYGDNGGRRVSAITGERRPVPEGDFAITVTRRVRYPDGSVAREPFTTTYREPPDEP